MGVPYPDLNLVEPLVHAQGVIDAFQAVAGGFEGVHLGREAKRAVGGDPSDDLERLVDGCVGEQVGWENADGWLTGDPCYDSWPGVICDESGQNVIGLDLTSKKAHGVITADIVSQLPILSKISR